MAILSVPNEILSHIINSHLYSTKDFADELSNDQSEGSKYRFGNRHSHFTVNIILVNRRFFAVAINELWRYVTIRTAHALHALAYAAPIHGHRTERLDLRLGQQYPPHLIYEILRCMPALRVYHMGNRSNSILFHHPAPPTFAVAALCSNQSPQCRPRLHRIEFDGAKELPAVIQLRHLLTHIPQLVSLRVTDVAASPHPVNWVLSLPPMSPLHLRFLSVGVGYGTLRSEAAIGGLNSFIAMLCAHPVLDRLENLTVMEFVPAIVRFLQVYGDRLRHVSIVLPEFHSSPSHNPNLIASCPRLESVEWIVKNCNLVDAIGHLPSYHDNLRLATLIYSYPEFYPPADYALRLERMLFAIMTGLYPCLQEVRLVLKGARLPVVDGERWFRIVKEEFAKRGITLALL
ncbi:hypothetical protein NMY22_g4484 [Coprinellus aureogranulatus]|nr:hypothetical protein NMY22_g4484 [Coprinellus aureogranulatus]